MNPIRIKIYYEDTDAGGVVYYANYLKYMERARTEFLLDGGIDVARYHEDGFFFVVTHVEVDYKRPARLGDNIGVTTEIIEITNVTITLRHQIFKENTLIVEAVVKVACINKEGKLQKLPEEFRKLEIRVN
jgi:tol-pal system-associated acyl-CoA thioesterase